MSNKKEIPDYIILGMLVGVFTISFVVFMCPWLVGVFKIFSYIF